LGLGVSLGPLLVFLPSHRIIALIVTMLLRFSHSLTGELILPAKVRKRRRWFRRILIVLFILIALGVLGHFLNVHFGFTSGDEGALDYDVSKVERGDITSRLTETGETYLENTVDVMSKVSGTITQTNVEEGDEVKKGQILAVVQPDNTELLRLYGKRAQVANAYITMVQAQDDLVHQKHLFDKVRGTSWDNVLRNDRGLAMAKTNFRLALMELHILESDMEIRDGMAAQVMRALKSGTEAQVRRTMDRLLDVSAANGKGFVKLADVRVLAPSGGVVIHKDVEPGEMVISGTAALNKGTVLFTIGDLHSMFISCNVSEVDACKLDVGQHVNVTFEAFPDESITGKIIWVSPVGTKPQGSSIIYFPVKIRLDKSCQFAKPGMSCDIDIITSEKKSVLRVLLESVATGEKEDDTVKETKYVYVKTGDTYQKREVKIGVSNEKFAEVLSGLKEGEEVVTDIDAYEDAQKEKEGEKGSTDEGKKKQKPRRRRHVRL